MRKKWINEESLKWVQEEIITEEQREKIIAKYEVKDQHSLIFFFAAILIGLAFLTFVAANWQALHHLIRMGIILSFLIAFYIVGEYFYRKGKNVYSVSCFTIAILIFGAGIFLSGQMYHYSMNSVFMFFVWGLVAFLIYLSRPYQFLLIVGLVIVSIGQIYGILELSSFDWFLFSLFIIAFGGIIFIRKNALIAWFFAISYLIQMTAFSFQQLEDYYWLTIFLLLLYNVGTFIKNEAIQRPYQSIALVAMFVITVSHALMFESEYFRNDFYVHISYYLFLVVLLGIAILLTYNASNKLRVLQLVLFLPAFIFIEYTTFISYIILFTFSISKLVEGYQTYSQRRVVEGTVTFLISTFLVYFQVAWNFLDKSLFFLFGGIVLFTLGYLLEKYRRNMKSNQREGV